jgi:hypothetical protein
LSDIESIIDKGIAVLKEIFTHPIQFVKHLIAAAKQGFFNFRDHFVTHLKDAIFDWLTGSLEGITLPDSWDLKGIASVALQLLGLTWTHIRGKLVTLIGEPVVKSLETGFDLVVTLVRNGPMAAWEKLKEMGEDIKQAFIQGVIDFVKVKIVQKAIETIVEFFVPGAGIVRAIIGIYDTIVFFIQKAKQILEMIGNFLGSIGEIAAGNIGAAADALEKGLARALLLAVNFLVRFLHLDGITSKIRAAIEKLRDKVDGALDRVAEWIVQKGKAIIARVTGTKDGKRNGKKDDRTEAQKDSAVAAARAESERLLEDPAATVSTIATALPGIQAKYRLTMIKLEQSGDEYDVLVVINPIQRTRKKKFDPMTLKLHDVVKAVHKDPRWLDPDKELLITGVVTSLDRKHGTFRWESSNLKVPRVGTFFLSDHERTWYRGHTAQIILEDDRIIELNRQQEWQSVDDARLVLNYRHHHSQFNPPRTQWEHIIEQSAGGAHSSGNLALTKSTINNRLNVLFKQPYASYEAPDGLPGTDGKPLRQYLRGKSLYIQNRWKQHFYRVEFNVSLKWKESTRGIWRELS